MNARSSFGDACMVTFVLCPTDHAKLKFSFDTQNVSPAAESYMYVHVNYKFVPCLLHAEQYTGFANQ